MPAHPRKTAALEDFISYGAAFSVALHAALALTLAHRARPPTPEVMLVNFVVEQIPEAARPKAEEAPAPPRRQIVTPPDRSEAGPPLDSRFISDRDSRAAKEQVRRGDGPEAGPVAGPLSAGAAAPPQRPAPGSARPASPKKLDLALNMQAIGDLAGRAADRAAAGPPPQAQPAPFSRPPGSGAQFVGLNGLADHLPGLPDGDITLLNTKAEKYAVFVRRVATQVFYQIKLQGWDILRAGDIHNAKEFTEVRAVLSPQGRLIHARIERRSGSRRFDETIQSSVERGARDPHPPPDAAGPDGNYHFVFQARSWAQVASDPRTGFPAERRWLLLRTGLE